MPQYFCCFPKKIFLPICLLFIHLILAGCTSSHTGAFIFEDEYQAIQPGLSQKEVLRILGAANFTGQEANKDWYYVTSKWKRKLFFPRKLKQRTLITVSFDDQGNLSAINRRDITHSKLIRPNKRITPTTGVEKGIFSDIFGNIGAIR